MKASFHVLFLFWIYENHHETRFYTISLLRSVWPVQHILLFLLAAPTTILSGVLSLIVMTYSV